MSSDQRLESQASASMNTPTRAAIGRQAPFFGLLAAHAISLSGNTLTGVALPWFVFATTGSAAETGLTAFFGTVPLILGAFLGGSVVDRLGFKRASVLADLASSAAVAAIPLLYATVGLQFWQLALFVFLGALLDAPGVTARESLLPTVARLGQVRLERANALYETIQGLAFLIGPALAGILIVVLGPLNVLWLNAGTFIVSAILMALTQGPSRVRKAHGPPQSYAREVPAGLRFVLSGRLIRAIILLSTMLIFLSTPLLSVVMPIYMQSRYDNALGLGAFLSFNGAGGILGALAYGAWGRRFSSRLLFIGGLIGVGLGFALISALPPFPLLLGAAFIVGMSAGPLNPLVNTVVQKRTPVAMRGRVLGAVTGLALAASPLGVLLAGYFIELVGIQWTLIGITACFLAISFGSLCLRSLREMDGSPK
jgi:MFS family permease